MEKAVMRCVHCGVFLYKGDNVVYIHDTLEDGREVNVPCCCFPCANEEIKKRASAYAQKLEQFKAKNKALIIQSV